MSASNKDYLYGLTTDYNFTLFSKTDFKLLTQVDLTVNGTYNLSSCFLPKEHEDDIHFIDCNLENNT